MQNVGTPLQLSSNFRHSNFPTVLKPAFAHANAVGLPPQQTVLSVCPQPPSLNRHLPAFNRQTPLFPCPPQQKACAHVFSFTLCPLFSKERATPCPRSRQCPPGRICGPTAEALGSYCIPVPQDEFFSNGSSPAFAAPCHRDCRCPSHSGSGSGYSHPGQCEGVQPTGDMTPANSASQSPPKSTCASTCRPPAI